MEKQIRNIFIHGKDISNNWWMKRLKKRQGKYDEVEKMKNGKTSVDENPVRVWNNLGLQRINGLCDLMNKSWRHKDMPVECKRIIVMPIDKGTGNVQEWGNYTRRLMSHSRWRSVKK